MPNPAKAPASPPTAAAPAPPKRVPSNQPANTAVMGPAMTTGAIPGIIALRLGG